MLDESGQWIENDAGRLAQLQALIEEAAIKGQGKVWIIVTTHSDMGSIYKEARALEGDMRKIEGRFRFKPALTTENIELVLEDRLFKKRLAGRQELESLYTRRGGVLRGLGELANTSQTLPSCTSEKFSVYYPFFPYHIHLIPAQFIDSHAITMIAISARKIMKKIFHRNHTHLAKRLQMRTSGPQNIGEPSFK